MELQPKEIIFSVISEIAKIMEVEGFKYHKSKSEIIKKTKDFIFKIWMQSNRYNSKGLIVEMMIHCSVSDNKGNVTFWSKNLAPSNAKEYHLKWLKFFPKEEYDKSLNSIKNITQYNLLPFFKRFEMDLDNFVEDVSENGFIAFGKNQIYDSYYRIPIEFLLKYGTKNHLNKAFQNYLDRHQLEDVKPNIKKAFDLLKEGKEVEHKGDKYYAEYILKYELNIKW